MWILKFTLIVFLLLPFPAFACADTTVSAGNISFRIVPEDESRLGQIISTWAATELAAQGGKYADHGWWLWGLTAVDLDRDGYPELIPTQHGVPGGLILRNLTKQTGKIQFKDATADFGVEPRKLPQGIGYRTIPYDFTGDGFPGLIGIRSPNFINRSGKSLDPTGKILFDGLSDDFEITTPDSAGYPTLQSSHERYTLDPKTFAFTKSDWANPLDKRLPQAVADIIAEKTKRVRFWGYHYITGHDLTRSGHDTVIISGFAGYNGEPIGRYLTQDAAGNLTDVTTDLGLPTDAAPILIADLDGRGVEDILTAGSPTAGLYRNDGKGKFTLQPGPVTAFVKTAAPYLHRAYTADFNNDGLLDLVLSNPRIGSTEIFANTGEGKFLSIAKTTGWDSAPVALCDINNDGLLDVCVGGPANTITIFLNTTPNPGNSAQVTVRMKSPNIFAAGAMVDIFRSGDLHKPGALPRIHQYVPSDGDPIRAGFGLEKIYDLRVTLPTSPPKIIERQAVSGPQQIND